MSRKRFLAIVDPWASPQPHDAEEFPHLESDSEIQYQLIHNQLPRLKPLFDDIIVTSSGFPIHPLFDELPSYGVGEYLSDKQDWDMWLCGFHYGRCIHLRIDEVIEQFGWNYSRFHVIQNLSWLFPGDTKDVCSQFYITKDALLNTKDYYWDYVGKLTELNEK